MLAVRGVSVALQGWRSWVCRRWTLPSSATTCTLWVSCSSRREPWPIMLRRTSSQRSICTCVPTGVAGNEFADVGAELGRRLQCTSLSWLWTGVSARREAVAISLYDALWWTNQLAKPDLMTERDDTRPAVERKLELCVDRANVRTLSPATDEPEVHPVRRRVLADAFSRKHIGRVGLQETRASNSTLRVCGGFHMVTSAAVFGQGGVEIWVRQCLCDSKDIFVLHATARILLIRVSICASPFMLCSARACCEASRSTRRGSLDGMVTPASPGWRDFHLLHSQQRACGQCHFQLCRRRGARMRSPRMASSFMRFWPARGWLSRLLSEVVEAHGRTVRRDGIGWITWESLAMSCRQFRAWRSIRMACWRSRSAKITAWLLFRCNGPFGGRHLSPLTPLGHVLQIKQSCGCQRFVISLNKSGVTCRLCRHNGLRRRWSVPLRSEGVRSLQRRARSQVRPQGMTGSPRRHGRRFALTAG